MHIVNVIIGKYTQRAVLVRGSGSAFSRQENWRPTPNPSGRDYIQLAMNANSEPELLKKKMKKKEH